MFGYANHSDTFSQVKTIMACVIAIKIAPSIDEDNLLAFLECVNKLNNLLIKYQELQDQDEKKKIRENIVSIGESLDEIGGHNLMELTCTYLTPNYDLAKSTESIWTGIGGHWYP